MEEGIEGAPGLFLIPPNAHELAMNEALKPVITACANGFDALEKERKKKLRFAFRKEKRKKINETYDSMKEIMLQQSLLSFRRLYMVCMERLISKALDEVGKGETSMPSITTPLPKTKYLQ